MLDSRVKFNDSYEDKENETVTFYYLAPIDYIKTILGKEYKEAVALDISLEFPVDNIEADYVFAQASPVREIEDGTESYDWSDIVLDKDDINRLISLAEEI